MSTISLRLPNSLHNRVRRLSKKDQVSINRFVSTAVAEKISALEAEDYLNSRAKRGSRKKFEKALPSLVTGVVADFTAAPGVELLFPDVRRSQSDLLQHCFARTVGDLAVVADPPQQPLPEHTLQRGRHQPGAQTGSGSGRMYPLCQREIYKKIQPGGRPGKTVGPSLGGFYPGRTGPLLGRNQAVA